MADFLSFNTACGLRNLAVEIKEKTMIHSNNNTTYYINPAYLTFVENSGYGANLIQVSASSSCYIRVFVPGVIGYDGDGNYRRWKITAYNNKFPDNDLFYIYVRLERNGASALIAYSKTLYNIDGSIPDGSVSASDTYYYIRIGEVSATDGTSIREISYDTGRLESDQVKNEGTEMGDMWEMDKISSPWLIKAKQWLASFTVKGFISLIGGLVFRKGEEEKIITDVKRSVDSDEDVPVSDESLPTTKYISNILEELEDKFLRKDQSDRTEYSLGVGGSLDVDGDLDVGGDLVVDGKTTAKQGVQIGESFVPGILTGVGGNIDKSGNAELESLIIRRFLEVPELRFNRVEVKLGDKWNAPGAGVFERVVPDLDENKKPTGTGTGWLKLEEGEIGAIAEGDICMGIFHSMNKTDNATADKEVYDTDENGNTVLTGFQFSGFYTCYFTITEITGLDKKEFRYAMRQPSGAWKMAIHPSAAMTFVSYGSFSREDRQTSVYTTRSYTRLLKGQNTWEIKLGNIAMQYGDLSNMNLHGENLDGYSMYCNNMYFTGKIQQMKPNGDPILTANDRGEWVRGTKYDFYDRVSHDGGLWLCINESGTNTEPKDGDPSWLCQVKSGQSVTAAGRWESSKVPYAPNSIVTFHEKVFISNKETSEPPLGIFTDNEDNRLTYMDGGYILVDTLVQSEDWNLLLDAPDIVDGKDGESLQARYSSDKSNWHSTFTEGDVWMQQRVGEKSIWSDPIRIVGEKGAAGVDGTYYDYQFAVNDSLDVAPSTGWQDTPPTVGKGQYLWMRTRFVNPNTQEENPWSVARIGGEKGRGVEKVTEYYQVSESNTIPPITWVKDTMPEMTETLKYLWNYEEVAYTDTEVVKTSPIVIGMYSKDGNGIKSVTETYGLTNSAEEQPTKWYADMPIPNKEVRYLWNKTVTEYTDGTPTTIIRIIAVHGETGDSIKAVGAWKSGLEVPALGVVTMAGKTFMAKVATMNPPMWCWTDKETNRIIYVDGGYVLTGEMNTEEYDLLIESGKDGRDGKDYEYIYYHTKDNKKPATPASVQTDDHVPSGWHDDPIGVSETFPYEWVCVRTKRDGVWSDYSEAAVWAKFGMDAILADLDNEMDNVALGADGKTTSNTTIAITAAMYYGSQKQALTAIQVGSVQGITSSYVLSTGVVTLVVAKDVTLNERTEVPITLTSSINGKTETRTLKFTLAAVKGGADGKDAVLYDIVTSVSSIGKRKDGSYTVNGVSAVRMKTIGEVSTETTDGKLKYSIDGGEETEISNNQTISSDKIGSKIQFFFYNAEGVVVDKESVPMVVDGTDGKDGEGFTMMGNWKSGLSVTKMDVVTMGGGCFAAKASTSNPPLWCWTDKDGNRLVYSDTEYILTGESNTDEYEQWSVKGADGKDGLNGTNGADGKNGEDGKTSYTHIAYANSSDGKDGFSLTDSEGKLYMGIYTDFEEAASADPSKYKWTLVKGAQGIQGCIIRDSEWAKGVAYRNDEGKTSGTRYIDVALVRVDKDALEASPTGWRAFRCIRDHDSSDENKPLKGSEWKEFWEEFSTNTIAIFTSLIVAKNAKINFLQGNQLLIQKNDGAVTAGLSGSEEGQKIRFWAGSDIPDNAPFRVSEDGTLIATKAEITGEVNATSGVFENVTISGVLRTPWKELEYRRIYSTAATDIYGFDGSAVSDDKVEVFPIVNCEILIGWGGDADGREVAIRVNNTNNSRVYVKVPTGYFAIDLDGNKISEGERLYLSVGYIYYLTGCRDCWIVNRRVTVVGNKGIT